MISDRLPPASDPEEQRLREAWHEAKEAWEADGRPSSSPSRLRFNRADSSLSTYLWNRVQREIEEDRRKHPRAKRNLPVGAERPGGGGRHLP